jgi:esterase
MVATIGDAALRQFLLTNLVRTEKGFRWQLGLDEIGAAFADLGANPLHEDDRYRGQADCIMSGSSGYFRRDDESILQHHFPSARLHVLDGVGHNVHIEGGERFLELVLAGAD